MDGWVSALMGASKQAVIFDHGRFGKTVCVPPLMYLLHIAGDLLRLLCLAFGLPGISSGITQRRLRLSGLVVGGGDGGVDGWDLLHGVFSCSFVVVHPLVKV